MGRRVAIGLALVALAVVAAFEVFGPASQSRVGKRAPALPGEVIVGPRTTVAALRGEPAAVNFWASWCTPCRREAPALELLHRTYDGGRIVGVNWSDDADTARAFVRDHHWTFPNMRDGGGKIGLAYGIVGLPTTAILDSRGRIVALLAGPQTVHSLRTALESAR